MRIGQLGKLGMTRSPLGRRRGWRAAAGRIGGQGGIACACRGCRVPGRARDDQAMCAMAEVSKAPRERVETSGVC